MPIYLRHQSPQLSDAHSLIELRDVPSLVGGGRDLQNAKSKQDQRTNVKQWAVEHVPWRASSQIRSVRCVDGGVFQGCTQQSRDSY